MIKKSKATIFIFLFLLSFVVYFFHLQKNKKTSLEIITPVTITNENPSVEIYKSDFVSFDIITRQYQELIVRNNIEKLIIHISDEEQLVNTITSKNIVKYGYNAKIIENKINLYIYLNANFLKKNEAKHETINNIEWLILESLHYLEQKINLPANTPIKPDYFLDIKGKKTLIDIEKDSQQLLKIKYSI